MTHHKEIWNIKFGQHKWLMLLAFFVMNSFILTAQKNEVPSVRWKQGELVYEVDNMGNKIPDYSYCGYQSSNETIPFVESKVVVPVQKGDATKAIQKAIDYVSGLPLNEQGFRGAVLLEKGLYEAKGRLKLTASGVVLRGSGNKTILRATGLDRETLIRVFGKNDIKLSKTQNIAFDYVPVGFREIFVDNISGFKPRMQIVIHRPSTQKWIDRLGMKEYGGETEWLGWKPGTRDIKWERTVLQVKENSLVLDAPLTTAIDKSYGGGKVSILNWPGRIFNVGIENLTFESKYNTSNPKDENHCWFAITMENITNAWVRQVSFRHFAGSAVALYETSSKVTVEDCISTDPVSEIAGWRRNTFFTMGQQNLFLRCYAENGCHDFAAGFMATGPNAFVQCKSVYPYNFSGAIDSWASGILFDNVKVDGHSLVFNNRGQDGQGAGWTAANSMFWQCSAARIECFAPPTAQNWAYGAWAKFAGNGLWYEANSHINPRSLFFAQLAERLKKDLKDYEDEILPFEGESTSSPTIEQAAEYTALAAEPPVQLKEYIQNAFTRKPISVERGRAVLVSEIADSEKETVAKCSPVTIQNGWLVCNNVPVTGVRFSVPWWRGDARPYATAKASPGITRFVPGRVGIGYTDNLGEVVGVMVKTGAVAIDHNYGLWYDRRRDDHERIRRFDPEVWAPFYEQPFSRSGVEEAWDRLSKYDLTEPNPWYWSRLSEFAHLAEQKGKILIHQNYFQHNILEAGAHWADSPWRPANNINNTGFPEPPPYAGDKRIYLAEQFYDVTHPVRRQLHRAFIRQCLDNFMGQSNVIQCTSAEYTGPLHFMEFWIDVIDEWQQETGEDELIALSCTKDVQDAILADQERSKIVDIIDIRYWAYRPDGTAYDPPGGANLAPRQHARKVKPGNRSFESVYSAVSEYRLKYPGKAVIYSEGNYTGFGWAVFMAGGSMPVLPQNTNKEFLKAAAEMLPFKSDEKELFGLRNRNTGMILYTKAKESVEVNLSDLKGNVEVHFLKPSSGEMLQKKIELTGGKKTKIDLPSDNDWITWIKTTN